MKNFNYFNHVSFHPLFASLSLRCDRKLFTSFNLSPWWMLTASTSAHLCIGISTSTKIIIVPWKRVDYFLFGQMEKSDYEQRLNAVCVRVIRVNRFAEKVCESV